MYVCMYIYIYIYICCELQTVHICAHTYRNKTQALYTHIQKYAHTSCVVNGLPCTCTHTNAENKASTMHTHIQKHGINTMNCHVYTHKYRIKKSIISSPTL
jgi:hypothetical protein